MAAHSPGGYSLTARSCRHELVLSAGSPVFVIMGATDAGVPGRFRADRDRPGTDVIHLISIPVTNTSVNPARSTGPAILVGGWALGAAVVWLAPIVGGIAGGSAYRWLMAEQPVVARAGGAGQRSADQLAARESNGAVQQGRAEDYAEDSASKTAPRSAVARSSVMPW